MEYGIFVGLLIGVLGLTIGFYQSWKTYELNRKVAEAQGFEKKSDISVSIWGSDESFQYFFFLPLKNEMLLELPFKMALTNTGDLTCEDIEIIVRFPRQLTPSEESGVKYYSVKKPIKCDMEVVSDSKNFVSFFTSREYLHPKAGIDILSPMFVYDSVLSLVKTNAEAMTADGVKVRYSYEVIFGWIVDVIIVRKNDDPFTKRISLYFVDSNKIGVRDYFEKLNDQNGNVENEDVPFYKFWKHRHAKHGQMPKRISIIRFEDEFVKKHKDYPIYGLKEGWSAKVSEGAYINGRYFVPCFDVIPKGFKVVGKKQKDVENNEVTKD